MSTRYARDADAYPDFLLGGDPGPKNLYGAFRRVRNSSLHLQRNSSLHLQRICSSPQDLQATHWHGGMYVTKPLSDYYRSPDALLEPPPQGPGSGILVIEDVDPEVEVSCCWGLCSTVLRSQRTGRSKSNDTAPASERTGGPVVTKPSSFLEAEAEAEDEESELFDLPLPQNRKLKLQYSTGVGERRRTYRDNAFFIPVIGQPLSSNRYYVIRADGRHQGNACTCSKEEDQTTFCFCTVTIDVHPSPFDHRDSYQQVEVISRNMKFQAKAVASDGIPPTFLRRKGWKIYTSTPNNYYLHEALGLDMSLRAQLPDLSFPGSVKQSSAMVVVGKWYCPFMFVKEGDRVQDQMKRSMFYEMTLWQFWEEIYSCENYSGKGKAVEVSTLVKREMALLNGNEVVHINMQVVDGFMWFKPINSVENGLGLNQVVWERMRWEESRGGWMGGEEVGMVEVMFEGRDGWKKFGCYVLVERFVLKRMDGSLALSYDFKHTNKIRTKWE